MGLLCAYQARSLSFFYILLPSSVAYSAAELLQERESERAVLLTKHDPYLSLIPPCSVSIADVITEAILREKKAKGLGVPVFILSLGPQPFLRSRRMSRRESRVGGPELLDPQLFTWPGLALSVH
jgi:hypothetical protein